MEATLEQKITKKEASNDVKTTKKELSNEVKFSWISVLKRWGKNMKDDMDPALTGAKAGMYFFHAGSTWRRELEEGKMAPEKKGIATLMGLLSGGLIGGAYYQASQMLNEQMHNNNGYFAAAGTIIAAQSASWSYEALKRAKKTECERVVMTRVQNAFDQDSKEFDLSAKGMLDALMQKYARDEPTPQQYDDRRMYTQQRHQQHMNVDAVKQGICGVMNDIFHGVVADGRLGRKYELTGGLHAGPKERKLFNGKDQYDCSADFHGVADLVRKTVNAKGGSANIELLGTVTAVYDGQGKIDSYQIAPNKVWKV